MIDADLLKFLCCPETRQPVRPADDVLIASLNDQIVAGKIMTRAGHTVSEKLDGGLVRSDGKFLFAIRQDIPVMLIDQAIPLPSGGHHQSDR